MHGLQHLRAARLAAGITLFLVGIASARPSGGARHLPAACGAALSSPEGPAEPAGPKADELLLVPGGARPPRLLAAATRLLKAAGPLPSPVLAALCRSPGSADGPSREAADGVSRALERNSR